jgi:lysine-specific demethylase 8/hypoxia-inducible factor 1-alpha inhibitor (HIF hydroxylase)
MQVISENKITNIPKINIAEITLEQFKQEYQKPGIPVIVTGLLSQQDWNLDYLTEKLGNYEFLARIYGQERYNLDKRKWQNIGSGVTTKVLKFTNFAEMIRSKEAHKKDIYLAKCPLKNTPLSSEETKFNLRQKLGLGKSVSDLNLWAGPSGHVECLHYDTLDGTLMQLHGAKKVILFPPSQTNNLYPFPIYLHFQHGLKLRSWFSQVYPEKPDFDSFPRFKTAVNYRQEIILNQGEVLFIPAGWWHEVTALGDSIVCSVNRFWTVYPMQRAIFTWFAWRTYLGFLFSMPYIMVRLLIALFSKDRKEEINKILRMF